MCSLAAFVIEHDLCYSLQNHMRLHWNQFVDEEIGWINGKRFLLLRILSELLCSALPGLKISPKRCGVVVRAALPNLLFG